MGSRRLVPSRTNTGQIRSLTDSVCSCARARRAADLRNRRKRRVGVGATVRRMAGLAFGQGLAALALACHGKARRCKPCAQQPAKGATVLEWYSLIFLLIDMRSFSSLWYWIALAVL